MGQPSDQPSRGLHRRIFSAMQGFYIHLYIGYDYNDGFKKYEGSSDFCHSRDPALLLQSFKAKLIPMSRRCYSR